jgi:hypothetical protein
MPQIHHHMSISDIIKIKPHAKELLFEAGLHTENTAIQSLETLGEVAANHGLSQGQLEELVVRIKAL